MFLRRNGSVETRYIQFPGDQFRTGRVILEGLVTLDLKVIDTDYTNYIIWHACRRNPQTGAENERIVVATRSYKDLWYPFSYYFNDKKFFMKIDEKIYKNNNTRPKVFPYGRCNCNRA